MVEDLLKVCMVFRDVLVLEVFELGSLYCFYFFGYGRSVLQDYPVAAIRTMYAG